MSVQTYDGIGGYFNSFLTRYPEPEQRFRAASRLLRDDLELGLTEHRSRIQLVARWAHDNDQLHPIAESMYALKSKLARNAGELVLSFVKGSLADIEQAEDGLNDQVVIRIGHIREGDLVHGAGASKRRTDQQPPLLLHAMGVAASSVLQIDADIVGAPDVRQVAEEGVLPVWRGASPVTEDEAAYWAEVNTIEHDVVVGDRFCLSVIGRIDDLTGQNGMLERYVRDLPKAA